MGNLANMMVEPREKKIYSIEDNSNIFASEKFPAKQNQSSKYQI
jgi:hypothetical protein